MIPLNDAFIVCINSYAGTQYTQDDDGLAIYEQIVNQDESADVVILTCLDEYI